MPVQRVSDLIAPWIQSALERFAQGDTITWEIALTPTPQGPGVCLAVSMPGMILNTELQQITVISPQQKLTVETVEKHCFNAVEQLREARSQQANLTEVPTHTNNGHGDVHGIADPHQ